MINIIVILNIILGLLFSIYIYTKFNTNYHAPNSSDVIKKTYIYNNKYYKLVPDICICPI